MIDPLEFPRIVLGVILSWARIPEVVGRHELKTYYFVFTTLVLHA